MSHSGPLSRRVAALVCVLACGLAAAAQQPRPQAGAPQTTQDFVIRNATVFTVTQGVIQNGSVLVRGGKIAGVGGADLAAPAAARVIDAKGKFVTPGIIDAHGHYALGDDINEATAPITPHMMMRDAFQYTDKGIYRVLAGGTTASLLMHGSANMVGGQGITIKHKFGRGRDELLFPDAPRTIKFASGENPKRVYGGRNQMPASRMGNFTVQRQALQEAREYLADWQDYERKQKNGDNNARPPKRDLRLEALADVLRGNLLVQIHCYRADEFLTEMEMAREFGYKIRAFHHALEAYKVADKIAAEGVAIATWPDWWGFKVEAWDATPWNAAISMRQGVRVIIHSDSTDVARRLNQEAGKIMRYGGVSEEEALRMVTLNPAWALGVDDRVGSIEVGKDADLVIWNAHPLSNYALADLVIIDGEVYFDRSMPGFGTPHYREGN